MRLLFISAVLSCACILAACASPDTDPTGQSTVQKRDKDADDVFTGSRLPAKR